MKKEALDKVPLATPDVAVWFWSLNPILIQKSMSSAYGGKHLYYYQLLFLQRRCLLARGAVAECPGEGGTRPWAGLQEGDVLPSLPGTKTAGQEVAQAASKRIKKYIYTLHGHCRCSLWSWLHFLSSDRVPSLQLHKLNYRHFPRSVSLLPTHSGKK